MLFRSCAKECGSDAISYVDKKAVIDYDKCKGCGRCIGACSFDAVYNPNSSANELLDRKMAEYAQAVCHGRPCFHISLVQDISPNCDCHGENDAPILPDITMEYNFREIEKKWQKRWVENKTYQVTEDETKKKFYVLNKMCIRDRLGGI